MTRKLEDMLIVQYVSIASTIVYLYDLVLTFGAETELVWTTRSGRVGQYVFFFNRYSPILGLSVALLELNPFSAQLSDKTYVNFLYARTIVAAL